MSDFYEIDFLPVETAKSGDAICLRYSHAGHVFHHAVDAGYKSTGEAMVKHIDTYYATEGYIDNVVVTHNDGDHARGLQVILETYNVGALYILRPWEYAAELLPRFARYTTVAGLRTALRDAYANLAALEDIALEKGIAIYAPFQGTSIGAFTVMAPTKARFLDLVVESDKTPAAAAHAADGVLAILEKMVADTAASVVNLVRSLWGDETFSAQETSAENEMSVVQYADIGGKKILLTGDTGRSGLQEVIDYAPMIGLSLPGIDVFQVPHHGSRRNVSTALLDKILGPRLAFETSVPLFSAFISSALEDQHHPRKSVERAIIHRGGSVLATEGVAKYALHNVDMRPGWSFAPGRPYPTEQEG